MTQPGEPTKPETNPDLTNPDLLREAALRRLPECFGVKAEVKLPPLPALVDHFVSLFDQVWKAVGRHCSAEELAEFRAVLEAKLQATWNVSQYSKVVVTYETDVAPNPRLKWSVGVEVLNLSDAYESWLRTREAPYFGVHADTKVQELARSLGKPAQVAILDVGAGSGRNTFALAGEGFPTDGLEIAPTLASMLREEASKQRLPVRVFEGNLFDFSLALPLNRYRMIVLAEVASHFRGMLNFRGLFQRSAKLLRPGGLLVFSAFLAHEGCEPSPLARQLSQVRWCSLFSREDLREALSGEPFELVSDESVSEVEKRNLPAEHWPPTGWFESWAAGRDLYDLPSDESACELRWLVYRRTA